MGWICYVCSLLPRLVGFFEVCRTLGVALRWTAEFHRNLGRIYNFYEKLPWIAAFEQKNPSLSVDCIDFCNEAAIE